MLATTSDNHQFSLSICTALIIGKNTIDHYYNKTDHLETYCISMNKYLYLCIFIQFLHIASASPSPLAQTCILQRSRLESILGQHCLQHCLWGVWLFVSCLRGIGAYWQWQWWWWQLHCCGIHGLGMYFFPWFIWWLMWHWQSILSSQNIFDNMPDLALISSDVHNELEHCLSTDTEDVKDTLLLWHNHYASFPSLSCMAWDYLSIPGK